MEAGDVGAEIGRHLARTSRVLTTSIRRRMRELGTAGRPILMGNAGIAAPGPGADRRFSRFKGQKALGVRVRLEQDTTLVRFSPQGPWKIPEEGADPHTVRGGHHPGTAATQGRGAWTDGQTEVLSLAERTVPLQIAADAEEAFRR